MLGLQRLERRHGATSRREYLACDLGLKRLQAVFGHVVQSNKIVHFFFNNQLTSGVARELVFKASKDRCPQVSFILRPGQYFFIWLNNCFSDSL